MAVTGFEPTLAQANRLMGEHSTNWATTSPYSLWLEIPHCLLNTTKNMWWSIHHSIRWLKLRIFNIISWILKLINGNNITYVTEKQVYWSLFSPCETIKTLSGSHQAFTNVNNLNMYKGNWIWQELKNFKPKIILTFNNILYFLFKWMGVKFYEILSQFIEEKMLRILSY